MLNEIPRILIVSLSSGTVLLGSLSNKGATPLISITPLILDCDFPPVAGYIASSAFDNLKCTGWFLHMVHCKHLDFAHVKIFLFNVLNVLWYT